MDNQLQSIVLNWIPNQSKVVDFGCGDGQLLRGLKNVFPATKLYGIDQTESFRAYIENELEATFLYNLSDVSECFDVISMVHVLEHLIDPLVVLNEIKASLSSTGKLFIQVPSYQKNPFDLLIYDHATFFSCKSLKCLLETAGFMILEINEDWVSKEISAICSVSEVEKVNEYATEIKCDVKNILFEHEKYLTSIIIEARDKICANEKVKVFGSSIGACWLAAEVGIDSVSCFLDEDTNRSGGKLFGLPIRNPTSEDYKEAVMPLDIQTKLQVLMRNN